MKKPKKYAFSLKIFLIAVILVNLGFFGYQIHKKEQHILILKNFLENNIKRNYSTEELHQLTLLDLSSTATDDQQLYYLKELKNLSELNLFGTQISDDGVIHLKNLPNLSKIGFSSSKISDVGLNHLKYLPNLSELHLYRMTTIKGNGFSHLKQLSRLYFQESRIHNSLVYLKNLPNISILQFCFSDVTDVDLLNLKEQPFKGVKVLVLSGRF